MNVETVGLRVCVEKLECNRDNVLGGKRVEYTIRRLLVYVHISALLQSTNNKGSILHHKI